MKILSFIIITFVFLACGSTTQNQNRTGGTISVDEFNALLTEESQLIDVRTEKEFELGFIKGAVNINWFNPNFNEQIKTLDKSAPVFIYCATGRRSSAAMNRLTSLGFEIVYDLSGGYVHWASTSLPLQNK